MATSIAEKIQQRAYELFLKRGGTHGYAMEDWLTAEREITAPDKSGTTARKKTKRTAKA